ncbi:hypothetical protein CRYUN_Cryun03dG0038000 [Craigia yunnanensis]
MHASLASNFRFFYCDIDGSFRLVCQAKSRRLLLLIAITLALVLGVQYFELPYIEVFTSLFAAGKNGNFPIRWSSSKSGMVDNVTLSNGLNSTHTYVVNEIENGVEVSNIDKETVQGNESEDKDKNTKNVYVSESNAAPEHNVTKDYNPSSSSGSFGRDFAPPSPPPMNSPSIPPDTKLRSSMPSVTMSSVGKNITVMLKKDKDPEFLNSTSSLSENVYSENTLPVVREKGSKLPKKKSKKPPQIVVSISEMNDLLLQSHASPHSVAPAETRGRLLNNIRALYNADIEVGFTTGKNVSLPRTYVRSAKDPLKSQGGNPPSQRHILAFFAGNMHGYVRTILFNYWGKDPDMKIFGPMPHVKGNTNNIEHMKRSKFCICARGHEVNSPQVIEAIFYECVPVIISDNFVPPLFDVLNWESFAVVSEKDIPNLKSKLLSISEDRYMEMH